MWISVPTIGTRVRASHPITCINPDETFEVFAIKTQYGLLPDQSYGSTFFIRGEKTCWFNIMMISEVCDD